MFGLEINFHKQTLCLLRFSCESLKWVIYTNQKKLKNNPKPPNNLVKISKLGINIKYLDT
ncbi:hypothetical protein HPMG_00188 [Helicobacter pullorum MIT 98-5489]|uniref:Uncharacterized protein n=1 Tax=Helicobacter pullorum MIT 98-5489 TaxID=537972 RepID=C5EXW1_9HELI|nr:hypothetical protein HPMG_00188 [Helicobacter pullorum MIT 98-5489]